MTAVSNERMVYTWGEGGNGQLGHGTQESLSLPEVVQVLKGKSIVRFVGARLPSRSSYWLSQFVDLWCC